MSTRGLTTLIFLLSLPTQVPSREGSIASDLGQRNGGALANLSHEITATTYRPSSNGLYRFVMELPPETRREQLFDDPSVMYYLANVTHNGVKVHTTAATLSAQLSSDGSEIEYTAPSNGSFSLSFGMTELFRQPNPFLIAQERTSISELSVVKYQIGLANNEFLINISNTSLAHSEKFETSWTVGSFPKRGRTGAEVSLRVFDIFGSKDINSRLSHLDGETSISFRFEIPTNSGTSYVGLRTVPEDNSVAAFWGASFSSILARKTGWRSFFAPSIFEPTSLRGLRRAELPGHWRTTFEYE